MCGSDAQRRDILEIELEGKLDQGSNRKTRAITKMVSGKQSSDEELEGRRD